MQIPEPVPFISTRWFSLSWACPVEASAQAYSPEDTRLWGQEMSGWMFSWRWIPPLTRCPKRTIGGREKSHASALSKNWLNWACQGPGDHLELRFHKSALPVLCFRPTWAACEQAGPGASVAQTESGPGFWMMPFF